MDPMVDSSNCARELIHIPGKVQSHGVFLALSQPELVVQHASSNTSSMLGIEAAALIQGPLSRIVEQSSYLKLESRLLRQHLQEENPILICLKQASSVPHLYNGIAHRSAGLLILELETRLSEEVSFSKIYRGINSTLSTMEGAADLLDLCQRTVTEVKKISDFERVMIYRFDALWNGQVIAEAKTDDLEPYLGLNYPASDIPAQARELYRINKLRIIVNVGSEPSEIIPVLKKDSLEPLDLSFAVLRSVSPTHIQYLKNMGVGASMSISILREGQLWGLIACQNRRPQALPFEVRQGLEFIGNFFSLQLSLKERHENVAYKEHLETRQSELSVRMGEARSFIDGLSTQDGPDLRSLCGATGAAICYQGRIQLIGSTPLLAQVRNLVAWLKRSIGQRPLFQTNSLTEHLPEAENYKDSASGLLCISIPEPDPSYVLWFRPEEIQTVNWSGNPTKAVEVTAENGLTPRGSFALWKETVRLKSLPWKSEEIEIVAKLRRSIVEVDLGRQYEAAQKSNDELDHFSHIVSHDLREPLRGIGKFAEFIERDAKNVLDEESLSNLHEIRALTERARTMISELYEFSKIGRLELAYSPTDLNSVVADAVVKLKTLLLENSVEIRIPRLLPIVHCDRARIGEVYLNLIGNAAKYSDRKTKWVEIGFNETVHPMTFFVRDNGIGIKIEDQKRVFEIFQRLHPAGRYGEGSGSGLSIVKRIIEQHGGAIKVESQPEKGSTFNFTLDSLSRIVRIPTELKKTR